MPRTYSMHRRAASHDETRERIVRACMALHDEQGITATSFADVARRAGVGAATVLRHFPTLGSLVMACGQHVVQEMRPLHPAAAEETFAGLATTRDRIDKLINELDAFYTRGSMRLAIAANDRDRVPELDQFLSAVDGGIAAYVREALVDEKPSEKDIEIAMALCSLPVWERLARAGLTQAQRGALLADILMSALASMRARKIV